SIAEASTEVKGELPGVDILVVDDGSADNTADTAASAGAVVAKLPYNLGVGGAMRTGYRYARDHGYDVAIQVDADGQHDPRYVPKLVDALDDTIEVLVRASRSGYRITQIPTAMRTRMAGTPSQSSAKATLYLGRAMIILILALIRV